MAQSLIQKQLGEFFKYLKIVKKRSTPTIEHYRFYLGRFLNWAKIDDINKINSQKIKAFKLWLGKQKNLAKKNLKSTTQNYHLIALRSFLKYLKQHGNQSLVTLSIKLSKVNHKAPEMIATADIEKILNSPASTNKPEIIKLRDRAILEMLFGSGLSVSELVNLKIKDLDFKKAEINIIKSNLKSRLASLSNQTAFWLKKYLSERKDKDNFVFVSHDRALGGRELMPLTARSVQRIVKYHSQKAGFSQRITPHKFRYYFAASLKKRGNDIKEIYERLGHNCLSTTKNYFGNS